LRLGTLAAPALRTRFSAARRGGRQASCRRL